MRVKVLSVHRPSGYQAPLIANVRILQVYRGNKPRPNLEMQFSYPPCGPAAIDVRPGVDLIVYNSIQPGRLFIPGLQWVDYQRARRFDPLVR
jgi:hypothetical protein